MKMFYMIFGIIIFMFVGWFVWQSAYNAKRLNGYLQKIENIKGNLNEIIDKCNKNIVRYNYSYGTIESLHMKIREWLKSVINSEAFTVIPEIIIDECNMGNETVSLCDNADLSKFLMNKKEVLGINVFLPDTYNRLYLLELAVLKYERWSKKYKKDVETRDEMILRRLENLENQSNALVSIAERTAEGYPQAFRERVIVLLAGLLNEHETDCPEDRNIINFSCRKWEEQL